MTSCPPPASVARALRAGAALVPATAVVAVDPAGRSPFVAAKWWAVSSLVALVIVGALRRDGRPGEPSNLLRALGVLVAWLALAAATGAATAAAWVGSGERTYGWVTWLVVAPAVVAGERLHRLDRGRSLLVGVAAAHVAMALWCLAELLGAEPVAVAGGGERLLGPFGSAAITASALLLVSPGGVAVGWSLRHHHSAPLRWLGRAAVGAGPVALAALGATGTRGAWLAAVAMAGLAAILWRGRRRRAGKVAAAVVGVIAIASLGAAPVADRLGTLWDRAPGGGAGRLDEWQAALGVIGDDPLLGAGPEGYLSQVVGHLDDHYAITYGREVLVDRAHSGPLDVAAIGGIPALMAWLVVLGALAALCRRAIGGGDPVLAAVAVGVAAYHLAQLLLFPIAALDPVMGLLVGVLMGADPPTGRRPLPRWRWSSAAATAVAMALVVWCAAAGAAHVASDRALDRALGADGDEARDAARSATGWRPDLTAGWVIRTELALRAADPDDAIRAADHGLRWAPHDPALRLSMGRALTARAAVTLEPADARAAVTWLESLATDDPAQPAVHLALGQALSVAGDAKAAIASFGRAAELSPTDPAPHIAAARVHLALGDDGRARTALAQALAIDPADADALELWADLNRGAP